MTKDRIEDRDPIETKDDCIDDVDRKLNPFGRFQRHNHMHAGTIPMVFDSLVAVLSRTLKFSSHGFEKE
jgi:hypothetical protein